MDDLVEKVAEVLCEVSAEWMKTPPSHMMAYSDMARAAIRAVDISRHDRRTAQGTRPMTDAPLSPADEAAVQLIVNTIIGRARMEDRKPEIAVARGGYNPSAEVMREMQPMLDALAPQTTGIPITRVIDEMLAAQSRFAVSWRDGVPLTPEQIRDERIRDGARAMLLSLFDVQSDTSPTTPASLGACRGGPTLALSDVANGVEAECVVCRMIVRADQVEHPVLGFKARCEGK